MKYSTVQYSSLYWSLIVNDSVWGLF